MRGVEQLKQHLVPKLAERGMAPGAIPLFIRGLAISIAKSPDNSAASINVHMRRMGWDGFDMDRDELNVVLNCFKAAGLKSLRQKPARWFFKAFEPSDEHPSRQPSDDDFETDPAFNKTVITSAASSRISMQK